MTETTTIQRRVLDYIEAFRTREGTAPTMREIADHFGFSSKTGAVNHVKALQAKGLLSESTGKARSLQIVSRLGKLRKAVFDIPIYGVIPAGLAEDREQDAEGCVSVDVGSIGFKPTRNTFALRVSGDSMIGKHICDGDIVVLEHGPEPRPGQIVAALIDRKSTLKTFLLKGGKPFLKAENPKYPNLIPSEELMIQGVFKALIRRAKE